MRIVFVQHGDYRETHYRLAAGGEETYYAQRYSDEAIQQLTESADMVAVICLKSQEYHESLSNGVCAIGIPRDSKGGIPAIPLVKKLKSISPTHLILRSPISPVIQWATESDIRLLPILADSFPNRWRRYPAHRRLAKLLNCSSIPWVCNHNVPASQDLQRIGVKADKIIPWDWPPACRPEDSVVKTPRDGKADWTAIYVGVQSEDKGLGDVINALAEIRDHGLNMNLVSIGGGETESFEKLAARKGVGEHVRFAGRLPHREVLELMRLHDIVVIPSRHSYPEGLPFTIYDALSVRTPTVTSDHPMFVGKLQDRHSTLVFRAGNVSHLVQRLLELASNQGLYQTLSSNSVEAFHRIECPAKWDEIIRHWLENRGEDQRWLKSHTLSARDYR